MTDNTGRQVFTLDLSDIWNHVWFRDVEKVVAYHIISYLQLAEIKLSLSRVEYV